MKISTKITIIISIIFALFFSLALNLSIYGNTKKNLDAAIHKNIESHSFTNYYLQTNLINYLSTHTVEQPNQDFVYDMAKMVADFQSVSNSFCLKDKNHYTIYANTDIVFSKYAFESEQNGKQGYLMVTSDNKELMLVRSVIEVESRLFFLYTVHDVSGIYQTRDEQLLVFYIFAFFAEILSILMIHVFIRKLIKPIEHLNLISKDIIAGNYEMRTNIHTNDEIGELSDNFDTMARAIESKVNEMQDAMKQRELFMGAFSHEIKTPMTSIIGYSDMLLNMNLTDCDKQKAYNFIYAQGKRLEVLSHELLSLFVLQQGDEDFEYIDTKELCKNINNLELEKLFNGTIVFDVDSACLNMNKNLIVCLFQNLIKNAIHANPKDDKVHIIGCKEQKGYHFYVLDYGIGMRQEDVQQCLNPFYIVDKSRSKQNGNHGLGLTICKEIVAHHNAQLYIDSIEDVGTCVSFTLEVYDDEE